MSTSFRWLRRIAISALCLVGVCALLLGGMLAVPIRHPPMLASIHDTASAVDRTGMPGLSRFLARDGTELAYRAYPAATADPTQVAVLAHGSSASSAGVRALAKGLAAAGIAAYALDERGHGQSGTRGDIGYVGQLEDDLADFVAVLRAAHPHAALTLIGHSSGGGFALRVAASPIGGLFDRYILLAPYLGHTAPTSRANSGGWATPDIPRLVALEVLRHLGISCCDSLPVLAFAVPPHSEQILTGVYSYRLMRNYAVGGDYRAAFAATRKPIAIFVGANDELMVADNYADASRDAPHVAVHILPGLNHMAVVSAPAAVAAVVATFAGES